MVQIRLAHVDRKRVHSVCAFEPDAKVIADVEIEVTDYWGQTERRVVCVHELLLLLAPPRPAQGGLCLPSLYLLNEMFSSGKHEGPGATFAWKGFTLSPEERQRLKEGDPRVADCPLQVDTLLKWRTWLRANCLQERYREALQLEIRLSELLRLAPNELGSGQQVAVIEETMEMSQRLAAIYRESDL